MSAVAEKVLTAEERARLAVAYLNATIEVGEKTEPYLKPKANVSWGAEEYLARLIREAVEEEREACARLCEHIVTFDADHERYAPLDDSPCGWCDGLERAAERIRARSTKD